MHKSVHVCIPACIYVCMHHIGMYVHIYNASMIMYVCIFMHAYTYSNLHECHHLKYMYVLMHIYKQACMNPCIHACIWTERQNVITGNKSFNQGIHK